MPSRRSKRICKSKGSIRGKIKTSKKYPHHLFQKNGNVWLRKNKTSRVFCICNVLLKRNPRYPQCKYHPEKEYPYEYNHRVLYEVFNGNIKKGMQVDHINKNGKDNRLKNLRLLTKSQNMQNRRGKRFGESKYKGVVFNKNNKRNPWMVRINFKKKQKYLGSFKTELQAYQAYQREAKKLNRTKNAKFNL
jgi:hypothetical protein